MDTDRTTVLHVLRVDEQDTMSGATYDQMVQLSNVNLNLDRESFIRMWKTLLLKRVQDTYEKAVHMRADNYVRLERGIIVPAPLSDLLYSIGSNLSPVTGHLHVAVPPARPAAPEPWWNLDADITLQWNQTMGRLSNLYVMKEFPSPSDYENKPIMLVLRNEVNHYVTTKAWTNEPTMQDGYIAAANDPLFVEHAYIRYANAALNMTTHVYRPNLVGEYASCYVRAVNS